MEDCKSMWICKKKHNLIKHYTNNYLEISTTYEKKTTKKKIM